MNRYGAAMDPQQGAPQAPQMPPDGAPPPGAPPEQAGAQSPALAEAVQILSGHQGPIGDLLKDPSMHDHLVEVLQAVKQDPRAIQALAQMGIGPEKIQQFEQALMQAKGSAQQPAPHWLAGSR